MYANRLRLVVLPLLLVTIAIIGVRGSVMAQADDPCEAILKHGIYDERSILSDESSFALAQQTYCRSRNNSRSGSFFADVPGYFSGSASEQRRKIDEYCSSDLSVAIGNETFRMVTRSINSNVVSAWSKCVETTKNSVVHYIKPTADPSIFTYGIQYLPNAGGPYESELTDDLIMTGKLCCSKPLPRKGDRLTGNLNNFTCIRAPESVIVVTASASIGGATLGQVQLDRASMINKSSFRVPILPRNCTIYSVATVNPTETPVLSGGRALVLRTSGPYYGNVYGECIVDIPSNSSALRLEYGTITVDWGGEFGVGGGLWLAPLPAGGAVENWLGGADVVIDPEFRDAHFFTYTDQQRMTTVPAGFEPILTEDVGEQVRIGFRLTDAFTYAVALQLSWLDIVGEEPTYQLPSTPPVERCAEFVGIETCDGDLDGNGVVEVSELVRAVNSALNGCPRP